MMMMMFLFSGQEISRSCCHMYLICHYDDDDDDNDESSVIPFFCSSSAERKSIAVLGVKLIKSPRTNNLEIRMHGNFLKSVSCLPFFLFIGEDISRPLRRYIAKPNNLEISMDVTLRRSINHLLPFCPFKREISTILLDIKQ